MRWVDVSGAEWRLKREGSGGRLLSLHGATHGGVKHGETARMIDGILRRRGHAMGVRSPLPFAGELDAHTDDGNPRSVELAPSGGVRARGVSLRTSLRLPQMAPSATSMPAPPREAPANTVGKKCTMDGSKFEGGLAGTGFSILISDKTTVESHPFMWVLLCNLHV